MSDDNKNLVSLPHIGNDRDFRDLIEACDKLLTVKGADYEVKLSEEEKDRQRVSNFHDLGRRLGLEPLQVLGVYMHKHLTAIDSYIARGRVESEPIEGRLADAVNYLMLAFKLIQIEKRRAAAGK